MSMYLNFGLGGKVGREGGMGVRTEAGVQGEDCKGRRVQEKGRSARRVRG